MAASGSVQPLPTTMRLTAPASSWDTFQIPYFTIHAHPVITFSLYYSKNERDVQ